MITVVMPSYLGEYPTAATNRDSKFIRAIQSVIDNSFQNWELIVISDGCDKTIELLKQFDDSRIKLRSVVKQKLWSGLIRNVGIKNAQYDWITYLDTDDMFGTDHLQIIVDNIDNIDWVWFNELIYQDEKFIERECNINIMGRCGTSNISHKKHLALWNLSNDYGQDWMFVKNLKKASLNFKKIPTPSYLVCHIPEILDV